MPVAGGHCRGFAVAMAAALLAHACSGSVRTDTTTSCATGDCTTPEAGSDAALGSMVPEPTDGSRLTGDGVDTRYGLHCTPGRAPDGTTRCLPETAGGVDAKGTFSDAACTVLIGYAALGVGSCGQPPPVFSTWDEGGTCGTGTASIRTYRVVQPIAVPQVIYQQGANGACVGTPVAPTDVVDRPFEVAEMGPDEWVILKREETPVTDALAVSFWVGSDGSRLFDGCRLRADDAPCVPFPEPAIGIVSHCLPKVTPTFVAPDLFTGNVCDTPIRGRQDCDGVLTDIAPPPTGSECPPPAELHRLEPVPAPQLQEFHGTICGLASPRTDGTAFRLGPAVSPDDYPEVDVVLDGTDRIRRAYLTSLGQRLASLGTYDTKLAGFCHAQTFGDGVSYCVGAGAFSTLVGGIFTDAGCSLGVASFRPGCGSDAPVAIQIGPGSECNYAPTFQAESEHLGPIYGFTFADPPGCAEIPREAGTKYYEPGESLEPSSIFAGFPSKGP